MATAVEYVDRAEVSDDGRDSRASSQHADIQNGGPASRRRDETAEEVRDIPPQGNRGCRRTPSASHDVRRADGDDASKGSPDPDSPEPVQHRQDGDHDGNREQRGHAELIRDFVRLAEEE